MPNSGKKTSFHKFSSSIHANLQIKYFPGQNHTPIKLDFPLKDLTKGKGKKEINGCDFVILDSVFFFIST